MDGRGQGVIFDLVAAQSPSYRGRGIARYSSDFVRAMVAHHPDLVAAVVLHPELEPPEGLEDLAEWLTSAPPWGTASVLHISSAFEPEVPVRTFWPREAAAHGLLTAVTLYDLIPELFPGWYLEDPGLRRRWRCCREVVRVADHVFTLSESARRDAIGVLGLPSERVTVIGNAPAPSFRPAESHQAAFEIAKAGVEDLEEGFIVYLGAFNPRKNVDGLVKAYASLPRDLIEAHQLVVVGEAPPLTRNHYLVMAKELGIDGRLLIPGFVPDTTLVSLYQSAALSVYPSLYEGFGLPLVESMACGAPTIGGDNSSLVEILPREARFEAEDPGAIAEAITKAFTDDAFRARLLALTKREPPTWAEVADRAAGVFEEMVHGASRRPRRWRARPQLALVGLPDDLASALATLASCDSFALPAGDDSEAGTSAEPMGAPDGALGRTGGDTGPALAGLLPWRTFDKLDPWRGGYDAVVLRPAGLEGEGLKALERLAATRHTRIVALTSDTRQKNEQRALSKLRRAGAEVLEAGGPPAETARMVAEAIAKSPSLAARRARPE
ncbi:MAG: glycosyltransferase family 1 protein [Actinomycetota bacterium]|nr:glycosyltransferase family 1 protein [Actinomycetota bacterium]